MNSNYPGQVSLVLRNKFYTVEAGMAGNVTKE